MSWSQWNSFTKLERPEDTGTDVLTGSVRGGVPDPPGVDNTLNYTLFVNVDTDRVSFTSYVESTRIITEHKDV